MSNKLMPYEKASRVLSILGWFSLIACTGMVFAMIAPSFVKGGSQVQAQVFPSILLVFVPLLSFILASAIKKHLEWGRIAGIIFSLVMLLGFPIGTIIGAYVLWCLIKGWDVQTA